MNLLSVGRRGSIIINYAFFVNQCYLYVIFEMPLHESSIVYFIIFTPYLLTLPSQQLVYCLLLIPLQLWLHNNEMTEISHYSGLLQERRNSFANALELRLSCTNPPIYNKAANNPSYTVTTDCHTVTIDSYIVTTDHHQLHWALHERWTMQFIFMS